MSSSLRIMHVGDLCLDGQFPVASPLDPDDRYVFQDASLKACDKLLYHALQENIDLLLITGRLFAEDRPTLRACLALQELCKELLETGVEIVIAGPDQELCELADVAPFIPSKVQYIPLKQTTPIQFTLSPEHQLQIGYRLPATANQHLWQIKLFAATGANTNLEVQGTQDARSILAPVGNYADVVHAGNVSAPDPLQPLMFRKQGRPMVHLLTAEGRSWQIKEINTAIIELRKKQLEVESYMQWEQLLNMFQSKLNEEQNEGLEHVVYHWKLMGSDGLVESLLDPVRLNHLLGDVQKISATFPRHQHRCDVIPICKYKQAEPTELEEIFHAAMFGEINTVGSGEPFMLPGLSSTMEDFVNQVADIDPRTLEDDQLFEQALKKGHQWLAQTTNG